MASTPPWKLYTADGQYMAAAKEPECLAASIALYNNPLTSKGATIRYGHTKIVWTDGVDGVASESYDVCTETCYERHIRAVGRKNRTRGLFRGDA